MNNIVGTAHKVPLSLAALVSVCVSISIALPYCCAGLDRTSCPQPLQSCKCIANNSCRSVALTLKYAMRIMYALQCYQPGIEIYFHSLSQGSILHKRLSDMLPRSNYQRLILTAEFKQVFSSNVVQRCPWSSSHPYTEESGTASGVNPV